MPVATSEIVMAGFSTAQQTINFIPAVALRVDRFVCFETEYARKENWSGRLRGVLADNKGLEFDLLEINEADEVSIATLVACITEKLKYHKTVYFNVGGGQKNHSIAMWECFRSRSTKGHSDDLVVYANQTTKQIERYCTSEREGLKPYGEILPLRLPNVTIKEIITLYGFEEAAQPGIRLYRAGYDEEPKIISLAQQILIEESPIREYAYKRQPKQEPMNASRVILGSEEVLKKIEDAIGINPKKGKRQFIIDKLNEDNSSEKYFFSILVNVNGKKHSNSKATYADYVEEVLNYRFVELIKQYKETHDLGITEAQANVKLKRINSSSDTGAKTDDEAEYDILIATDECHLIALDAKTYVFEKKDEDARRRILNQAGGYYTDFAVVMPYYKADVEVPSEGWWWKEDNNKKLRVFPNELNKRGTVFFAFTDQPEFYISPDGLTLVDEEKGIRIRSFQYAFEDLKLVRDKKP